MSWDAAGLAAADAPDEIDVIPDRADGAPGPAVIVWAVAHDGALYVRSARGPQGGWYRRAMASGTGRIRVRGVERAVTFTDASADADHAAIDAAYHAAYDRYGARIVGGVVGEHSYPVTVRIDPAP